MILELLCIIIEPLRLPEWTIQFAIVFLCIGFFVAVILSWIYDIYPDEGMVKTKPAGKERTEDIPVSSKSWKIASYVSFVVIVAMVCIMLYPKIFKNDQLKELRDEEGMISLAVLPFDNLTGDSSLYFWQNGISEYLINKLGSSQELTVSSSQVILDVLAGSGQVNKASLSPGIARQTANKIDASTYITGNFIGKENNARIMLNLVNTGNGKLIWSTSVSGDLSTDFQAVLDHLSDTVRNYMEIRALEDQVQKDFSNAYPNLSEAYRYYIDGLNNIVASNYEMAEESLLKSYELDTSFTFAAFYLAFAYFFGDLPNWEDQNKWTIRAYELKDNIPQAYHPWIELWYAWIITEDGNDIRRYTEMLYEATHYNRFLLLDLGMTYTHFFQDYNKSIQVYQKLEALNQRWEDNWKYEKYYDQYTWTLLLDGRPEKVQHIADIGLRINPENDQLVRRKGAAAIMMKDSAAVQRYREEFISLAKQNGHTEAFAEFLLGNMHRWGKDYVNAADHYRRAYELDKEYREPLILLIQAQLSGDFNIEESLELSEYGLEQDPENESLLWSKGLSLHKLGRSKEALAILLTLKERYPNNRELQNDYQEVEQSLALHEQ